MQGNEEAGRGIAFESSNGRYIYYWKSPGGAWRMPVGGGDEELVLPGISFPWALTDKGIYFMEAEGEGGIVKFFSFATQRVTRVTVMERPPALGLTVSPDERWLLYTQRDVESQTLMLVENFR